MRRKKENKGRDSQSFASPSYWKKEEQLEVLLQCVPHGQVRSALYWEWASPEMQLLKKQHVPGSEVSSSHRKNKQTSPPFQIWKSHNFQSAEENKPQK